ncbi:MAG: DUF427 domain-containing protein [Anaerolineae bacterium]|nr:DUF427 domain-containing protein [Anaerolineae bacterium]
MPLIVTDLTRGQAIAQASTEDDAIRFENAWYLAPEQVDMAALEVTERTYICPYKGVVHWIDLHGADGRVYHEVAWTVPEPQPGFQRLQGRIAFYQLHAPGVQVSGSLDG